MEDLASWYSFAKRLSSDKEYLQSELENAERAITGIKESLEKSQSRLLEMLSEDSVSLEEINLQERHLQLVGRLFIRKRTALIRTSASHCLAHFRKVIDEGKADGLDETLFIAKEISKLICKEDELPRQSDQIFKDLRDTVNDLLERGSV